MSKKIFFCFILIFIFISQNLFSNESKIDYLSNSFFLGMGREVGGGFGGGYTLRINHMGLTIGLGYICKEYCGLTYSATLKRYFWKRDNSTWFGIGYGTAAYINDPNYNRKRLLHGPHILAGIKYNFIEGFFLDLSVGMAFHRVPEPIMVNDIGMFGTGSANIGYQFTRR